MVAFCSNIARATVHKNSKYVTTVSLPGALYKFTHMLVIKLQKCGTYRFVQDGYLSGQILKIWKWQISRKTLP